MNNGTTQPGWLSREAVALVMTPILLLATYYLRPAWLAPPVPQRSLFAWMAVSFICLFVIPAAVIAVWWRRPLSDFGLSLGRPRLWLPLAGAYLAVALPALIAATRLFPSIALYYPRYAPARHSLAAFALSELAWLAYFFAWEFFFRGFLLFTLLPRLGPPLAIVMQMVPFALMHLPKPAPEAFASVFAGLALGFLAWIGRSALAPWLVHFLCALAVDAAAIAWRP